MKKYFIKIVVISLIVAVFPVANNFCFQGILGHTKMLNTASAAAVNTQAPDDMGMDSCIDNSVSEMPIVQVMQSSHTSHNNSILPCCVGSNHPTVIISSQTIEIEKNVPVVLSSDIEILKIVSKNTLYTPPIISPPKLLAVRTTVLRL